VLDLMEALRRSVEDKRGGSGSQKAAPAKKTATKKPSTKKKSA
jgi:hypothetical protein